MCYGLGKTREWTEGCLANRIVYGCAGGNFRNIPIPHRAPRCRGGADIHAVTLEKYRRDVIPIMTWGGLKGGISVALALSVPENEYKPLILTVTYIVVLFSIIVQGLTIAPSAKKLDREQEFL